MKALRIVIADLGGSLHLDRIDHVMGRPVQRAPMVAGSARAFGPFAPPVEMAFDHGMFHVEVILHSVGAVAFRIACDVERPFAPVAWPDPIEWRADIARDVAPALYERYEAAAAAEAWDVRIVDGPPASAAAVAFIGESDAPMRFERPEGGILVGTSKAVIWGPHQDILDILELARAELLEFRAYDAYLDRRLESSFAALDRLWSRAGLLRSARKALRDLSHVRLEVARLTDPLHGTGKMFGDAFAARLHAAAQERLRIKAWEEAVIHKTDVLEDMFHLAQEEANHRRALVLETMIVLLFVLDIWTILFLPH